MHLLITGASGHIGSNISNICNIKKIKSILLTRSKKKKLSLKKNFKNCLVKNYHEIKKKDNISYIIHTASINDIESNKHKNPIKYTLGITKKIFSKLDLKKVKKVIYLSTAQVYGSNLCDKVSEQTKPYPKNRYGLSRLANEKYLYKLSKRYNFKLIVVRISNVVGDTIFFDKSILRLLPNDIKNQAKLYNIINLRSSGLQYRNFISMENTIKCIIKLIKIKTKKFEIFNLGGVNISIINFVKKYISLHNKKYRKKIKLNILSNEPKKTQKLFYIDLKLRTLLKKKKESAQSILRKFV